MKHYFVISLFFLYCICPTLRDAYASAPFEVSPETQDISPPPSGAGSESTTTTTTTSTTTTTVFTCPSGQHFEPSSPTLCCLDGQTWASGSNTCCDGSKIATNGTCCSGATPVLVSGICCASGQINASGHCCASGQVWASASNTCCASSKLATNGTCCSGTTPYVVSGVCSECDAANEHKVTGAPGDGCCPIGQNYYVNGACSAFACVYYTGRFGSSVNERTGDPITYVTSFVSGTGTATGSGTGGSLGFGFTGNTSCFSTILNNALNTTFNFGVYGTAYCSPPRGNPISRKCSNCLGPTFTTSGTCKVVSNACGSNAKEYYDDCIAWYFKSVGLGNKDTSNSAAGGTAPSGTVYFDSSCNIRSTAPTGCGEAGNFNYRYFFSTSSPISLIWDEKADVESVLAYVNFPLDPTIDKKWWIWKASGKTPLLVYDPEHKGEITSAEQLFGSWTFGGSKVASLLEKNIKPRPWIDGYQALRTMDLNLDQEVSGKELETLALWFDENQDGVSQAGEVASLVDLKVKKLYLKTDFKDPVTGNVHAHLGFEREENGKTIKGSSVDWFTEGANTPEELYNKHFLNSNNLIQSTIQNKTSEFAASETSNFEVDKEIWPTSTELTGVWNYKLSGTENKFQNVMIVIRELEGNKIEGTTFTQLRMETTDPNYKSMIRWANFTGTKSIDASGKISINFEVVNEDGSKLLNQASLNIGKKMLLGTSEMSFEEDGKNKELKYRWEATKINIQAIKNKK